MVEFVFFTQYQGRVSLNNHAHTSRVLQQVCLLPPPNHDVTIRELIWNYMETEDKDSLNPQKTCGAASKEKG